jgi:alkylation response protein AidB-like acyl-CoA dehydrogenase
MSLFATVAAQKTPTGSRVALRELPQAQLAFAEAEARLRAGRAFVLDTVQTVWQAVLDGREITRSEQALVRLACATCCRDAIVAVDGVAAQLGMTATTGPAAFARSIRDVRVVPQHFWVAPAAIVDAGQVLLGLDPLLPGL